MPSQFEITASEDQTCRFRLRSPTGATLLLSVNLPDHASTLQAIERFQKICMLDQNYQQETLADHRYRFRVVDSAGEPIGESPAFDAEKLMQASIKLTQLNGARATVATDASRRPARN